MLAPGRWLGPAVEGQEARGRRLPALLPHLRRADARRESPLPARARPCRGGPSGTLVGHTALETLFELAARWLVGSLCSHRLDVAVAALDLRIQLLLVVIIEGQCGVD